jgi:hypothetical protein
MQLEAVQIGAQLIAVVPGVVVESGCNTNESVSVGLGAHSAFQLSPLAADRIQAWLGEELHAEREAVQHQMELRHQKISNDLRAWLKAESLSSAPITKSTSFGIAPITGMWRSKTAPFFDNRHVTFESEKLGTDGPGRAVPVPAWPTATEYDPEVGVVVTDSLEDVVGQISLADMSHKKTPKIVAKKTCSLTTLSQDTMQDAWRARNFSAFIQSPGFEMLCAGLVVLNAFFMAAWLQYEGINAGYSLGIRQYDHPASTTYPHAEIAFKRVDLVFTLIFLLELLLRLKAYRCRWFCSVWNYLDVVVIGLALSDFFLTGSPLWKSFLIRLGRFGKVVRIVRALRAQTLVDSLRLLVVSIQASCNTLCISLLVLLLIQSVAGMLLSQLVEPYINDVGRPEELRREVFAYYGTFWRSMVTMFEITFANWVPTCRLLLDNVSEWFGLFFMIYRCVVGFAMLSVIQAVFIQQTMKSAQLDEDFMIQQKSREKQAYARKLLKVFTTLDTSGDGYLSWDEFEGLFTDPRMKLLLSTLEVDVHDLQMLFKTLDDGDNQIAPAEFVEGLQRMKGPAKALDLLMLSKAVHRIEAKLHGVEPQLDSQHDTIS